MHKKYKTVLPPQAAAAQGQLASSPAGIPTLDSSAQGIIGLALHFFLMLSELSTAAEWKSFTHSLPHDDMAAQGTSMASHPGMVPGVSPYPAGYSLANIPGVDWSALGYSLPAMYTL